MSAQQMIDLAHVIFAKQPILLQHDLRLGNRKPAADCTWPNVMDHFCEAQADLNSLPTAGDICHQQPAHQANIATMADLVAQHFLKDQTILQNACTMTHPTGTEPAPPESLTDVANSLQCQETDLQFREASMMPQMQDMMMTMMRNNNNNNNNNNSHHDNCDNSSQDGRNSQGCDQQGHSGGRGNNNRSKLADAAGCMDHVPTLVLTAIVPHTHLACTTL
jgi:hypothetical protein